LMSCGQKFAYVDILQNPDIRAELPKYANWPTFPQLWVKGELVGGSDIILELAESGELQTMLEAAAQHGARPPADLSIGRLRISSHRGLVKITRLCKMPPHQHGA